MRVLHSNEKKTVLTVRITWLILMQITVIDAVNISVGECYVYSLSVSSDAPLFFFSIHRPSN